MGKPHKPRFVKPPVKPPQKNIRSDGEWELVSCPTCNGTGKNGDGKCPLCDGERKIWTKK